MTEEQYKVLEKYDSVLNAAVKSNFLRLPSSEFNEIAAVYDQLFTPLRQSQRNCNTCRLNALKTIGRVYFDEKEKRAAEAAEKTAESGKQGGMIKTITNAIKRAGKPRKLNDK